MSAPRATQGRCILNLKWVYRLQGIRTSDIATNNRLRMTQVALLGAAGGIGQPLGLLLKMNKYISELSLYDIAPFTPGVAKDLSHCNTPSKVTAAVAAMHAALSTCAYPVVRARTLERLRR